MYKNLEGNFDVDKWVIENDTIGYISTIDSQLHQKYLKILLEQAYLLGAIDQLDITKKFNEGQ